VELLRAAGHIDFDRTPLAIPAAALAAHEPHTADRLKSLAAMPYRLSLVRADSSDRETAAALYTLRSTANAADRRVLWLSVSEDSATTARTDELADTITTIDRAHEQVSAHRWALPPGAIVIIDNPAAAEPHQLAAIASHAADADARVIIIDPATSHGASSPALRLLTHTVPWATALSTADAAPEDPRLEPTPAVTLADRLGRTHLGEPWRQLLTEYDTAARAVRAAQRRHFALGWRTPDAALDEPDHALEAGVDDA
jgi:hypothetical protein